MTYGEITHGPHVKRDGKRKTTRDAWSIQCLPHVAIRIKRVFARIDKGQFGTLLLDDTPENCRELLWFLDRYPMKVDPLDRLQDRANQHKEEERRVGLLLRGSTPTLPFDLAVPLREYQKTAVAMVLSSGALLLADDVGLGKSCQAIGMFADPKTLPALVITLTHLPRQWEREIARFTPHLRVHVAKTTNPEELHKKRSKMPLFDGGFPDVIVMNYHKIAGWAHELSGRVRSIVLDEGQELRSGPGTEKYNGVQHVAEKCDYRMALTATPIFNFGGEMFHLLNILKPDAIGSIDEFKREWCQGSYDDRPKIHDPEAFGGYLRDQGLMLRRTRKDVGREIPPVTTIVETIDADIDAIHAVETRADELAHIILTQGGLPKGAQLRASEELSWRLRQATGIAKARTVADFCRILVENGEKLVLFGYHHEVYEIWKERLADLAPAFYTGRESDAQKQESIERFTDGRASILVMSVRAGAGPGRVAEVLPDGRLR